MALYVVERDLGSIAPEQHRRLQHEVASVCRQLKAQGNRIRYISSVVVPADGLGVDPTVAWARPRRSRPPATGASADSGRAKGSAHPMTSNSAPELSRWLADGQRLFGVCLETLESYDRLQSRNQTLETENEMLREEVARLRHRVDVLQTDRSDMVAAFNDLAGHVTQVVDHILQKSEDGGEDSKQM